MFRYKDVIINIDEFEVHSLEDGYHIMIERIIDDNKHLVLCDGKGNDFVISNNRLYLFKCDNQSFPCCKVAKFNIEQIEPIVNIDKLIPITKMITRRYLDLESEINEQLRQGKRTKRAN